ncbi:calcium-binding protein [Streptomyces sp. 1222.5]|uniref:calcium-binding protein n=1 Tax=Streptomyces sp. 1222.5 TaxID=1881026 RepID=UPI003EBB5428
MRKRTATAALVAVTAFYSLAAPVAQADSGVGDTVINSVLINDGEPVVIGVSDMTFPVIMNATDDHGVGAVGTMTWLWRDSDADHHAVYTGYTDIQVCQGSSPGPTRCLLRGNVNYRTDFLANYAAGTWNVAAKAVSIDGDYQTVANEGTIRVLRQAHLTVNASPEPVTKGKILSVIGLLSRANWETRTFDGYGGKKVNLQFRKAHTSTYTTVKSITSSGSGALKTTITASTDGCWRFSFAGSTTTSAANATGDCVDVK